MLAAKLIRLDIYLNWASSGHIRGRRIADISTHHSLFDQGYLSLYQDID